MTAALGMFLAPACGNDSNRKSVSNDGGTRDARSDGTSPNNDAQATDSSTDSTPGDSGSPDSADGSDSSSDGGVGSGGPYLYFADNTGNRVNGFVITPSSGALTPIDMDPATLGVQGLPTSQQPLAVTASTNGKYLFTAHTNGNIGTYAIDAATGVLVHVDTNNADAGIQDFNAGAGVGLFGIAADPKGRVLYASDVNGNQIITLSVNASTGALAIVRRTAVAAHFPRGIVVDPQAHFLFVVGNLIPAVVTRVTLDDSGIPISPDAGGTADVTLESSGSCASGALSPAGRVYTTCAQDQKTYGMEYDASAKILSSIGSAAAGISPIGVAVHPNGNFAYAASFSNASITTYSLGTSGAPTVVGSPLVVNASCRTLAFDGTGAHLFAGCDGKLLTFDVNGSTGAITQTGSVDGPGDSTYSIAIVTP